jgi:tRNA(fMet)-specific endonuclease VapC
MDNIQLCLDTSALIAYLRGTQPMADAVERAVKECTCFVTAITVYELLFGVTRARKQIGDESLLSVMSIVPFDEVAARRAALLHNQLISSNADIGIKDVFIAAICLGRALPILTRNEQHFARVSGLEVLTAPEFLMR